MTFPYMSQAKFNFMLMMLYLNVYSMEDCHQLQCVLDSLTQWAHKWLMTFNPIKCEFPTNNKQDKHHTIHLPH